MFAFSSYTPPHLLIAQHKTARPPSFAYTQDRGFTLLEVILASGLFALILSALLRLHLYTEAQLNQTKYEQTARELALEASEYLLGSGTPPPQWSQHLAERLPNSIGEICRNHEARGQQPGECTNSAPDAPWVIRLWWHPSRLISNETWYQLNWVVHE